MGRLVEAALPARMGTSFRWLVAPQCLALIWRQLAHVAHADEEVRAAA